MLPAETLLHVTDGIKTSKQKRWKFKWSKLSDAIVGDRLTYSSLCDAGEKPQDTYIRTHVGVCLELQKTTVLEDTAPVYWNTCLKSAHWLMYIL